MKTPKEIVLEEDLSSMTDAEFDRFHDRIVTRAYGDPAGITGWEMALSTLDDEYLRRYGSGPMANEEEMRVMIAGRYRFKAV